VASGKSLHETGFSIDVNWNSIPPDRRSEVVDNAKAAGLGWGGEFKTPDRVHFYKEVPGGRKNRAQYIQDAQRDYREGTRCGC